MLRQSTPLLSYNDEWRIHRKLSHIALSPNAIKQYYYIQEDLAALLSQQFLEAPEKFVDHVRLYVNVIHFCGTPECSTIL